MNEIQETKSVKTFMYGEADVYTVEINGEPWFVGKDVAVLLGYKNPQEAIREHVDTDDKGVSVLLTPGGEQNATVINESGLYSLIFRSKLESAKRFKKWVTSEVLPQIRKTGGYMGAEAMAGIEKRLSDMERAIAAMGAKTQAAIPSLASKRIYDKQTNLGDPPNSELQRLYYVIKLAQRDSEPLRDALALKMCRTGMKKYQIIVGAVIDSLIREGYLQYGQEQGA